MGKGTISPRLAQFINDRRESEAVYHIALPKADTARELCVKCGQTYYRHIENADVVVRPCWTPSGRYSQDRNTTRLQREGDA